MTNFKRNYQTQRKSENQKNIFVKSNHFYKMDKNCSEKLMKKSVTKLQTK